MTVRYDFTKDYTVINSTLTISGTTPALTGAFGGRHAQGSLAFIKTGTVTDAGTASGIAITVTESDDGTTYTAVDADHILVRDADGVLCTLADIAILLDADDNVDVGVIQYNGFKEYWKVEATGTIGSDATLYTTGVNILSSK